MEPAADLAILAAMVSSMADQPLPTDVALFGEIGLVGEVRATPQAQARVKEAGRHGFRRILTPARAAAEGPACSDPIEMVGVSSVQGVLSWIGELTPPKAPACTEDGADDLQFAPPAEEWAS